MEGYGSKSGCSAITMDDEYAVIQFLPHRNILNSTLTNQLYLFRRTISVYREKFGEQIRSAREMNSVSFLMLKQVVSILTIVLWMVRSQQVSTQSSQEAYNSNP
jgi:hypothetical protein